jgi:hypothetical protein
VEALYVNFEEYFRDSIERNCRTMKFKIKAESNALPYLNYKIVELFRRKENLRKKLKKLNRSNDSRLISTYGNRLQIKIDVINKQLTVLKSKTKESFYQRKSINCKKGEMVSY